LQVSGSGNPKGTLKCVKSPDNIYQYAWMDGGAVYFIDSYAGCGELEQIQRKNKIGEKYKYDVPKAIKLYNQYMGGVDIFDQVRTKFIEDHL
jgi:hypothetical protein